MAPYAQWLEELQDHWSNDDNSLSRAFGLDREHVHECYKAANGSRVQVPTHDDEIDFSDKEVQAELRDLIDDALMEVIAGR